MKKNLFRLLAGIVISISTLAFSSCNQASTTDSTPGTVKVQTPTDNPNQGKNHNPIQSVTFTVNNHNGHGFAARVYSGATYDDIIVPSGIGTSYFTITDHCTLMVVNGQTVYSGGGPTQVTLPDNTTTNIIIINDTAEQN